MTSVVEAAVEPVDVDVPVVALVVAPVVVAPVDEEGVEVGEFPDELLEPQPLRLKNKLMHAK